MRRRRRRRQRVLGWLLRRRVVDWMAERAILGLFALGVRGGRVYR